MKLSELKGVFYSVTGDLSLAVVYDLETNTDLEYDCSIEYAIREYGDKEVRRITAHDDHLVITL